MYAPPETPHRRDDQHIAAPPAAIFWHEQPGQMQHALQFT